MSIRHFIRMVMSILVVTLLAACNMPQPQTSLPTPTQPEATAGTILAVLPDPASQPVIAETAQPAPGWQPWVAFIGVDGNVWMADGRDGSQVQVTFDAAGYAMDGAPSPVVIYQEPQWSDDGLLLAYERQDVAINAEVYIFTYSLWIYTPATGVSKPIFQGVFPASFDWKPGAHILAFGEGLDMTYFGDAGVNPSVAKGISVIDADSGSVSALVPPKRGYHLVQPRWSPDGRFISFNELYLAEGAVMFAVYNLATGEYFPWDQPVGDYAWSANSETILFDDRTYVPQGTEAIYSRSYRGGEVTRFSPPTENAYFFFPAVEPESGQVAFLGDFDGIEGSAMTLSVFPAPGSAPQQIGIYENVGTLQWTAGWAHILLTRGPWENQEIVLVNPNDGSETILGRGNQPDWNPSVALQ